MAPLKILISGAGIAGTSLAFWLARLPQNHEITVIERFPTLRTSGLQIDLRGHGISVLKLMGLDQAYRAKSPPEEGLETVDSRGRRWAFFPANKSGKGLQSFTTDWEIMRGDFCRLVYEASTAQTNKRVKYLFGTTIERFEEHDAGIDVWLSHNGDTRKETFDLLVGADGLWSATRKMMLGTSPTATEPDSAFHPLGGRVTAYFTVKRPILPRETYVATMYAASGGRAIMARRHRPDAIQVYLMCRTHSERLRKARRGDTEVEKEVLDEVFKGAGWRTEEFLRAMHEADDFYLERMGLVKIDRWASEKGRVVLVGDAAYCPSANTGMGTTSSVVGTYVLAGEIGRFCGGSRGKENGRGIGPALEAYEKRFRPFMEQVQKGVLEDEGIWIPSTEWGVFWFNFLLMVAAWLRLNVIGTWFLKEKVKGWELPEYKEMVKEDR